MNDSSTVSNDTINQCICQQMHCTQKQPQLEQIVYPKNWIIALILTVNT